MDLTIDKKVENKITPNDEITIYDTLTNGQGVISVSRNTISQ